MRDKPQRSTPPPKRTAARSSLEILQRELAALTMDEGARQDWQADPNAYAERAGLRGRDARLLATLVPADVQYYASRRWVDRWSFLQGDMPRSVAIARRDGCLYAYFRAVPYPFEDSLKEAQQFARWLRANPNAVPCLLPDVAAYEVATAKAWRQAVPHLTPAARPRKSRGVQLLTLGHDFFDQLDRPIHDPPHAKTHLALVRRPGAVDPFKLDEPDFLLAKLADGKRTEAELLAEVGRRTGASARTLQASLRELRREGLLHPVA